MSVTLDLRMPSVVILGFWNQAILNEPAWIARHILDADEGEELEITKVIVGDQHAPRKSVDLFEKFGVSCQNQRIELYQTSQGSHEDLYGFIRKLSDLLPHTPVTAIGTNFHFLLTDGTEALNTSLETDEVFDAFGVVKGRERSDSIQISDEKSIDLPPERFLPCILNLKRISNFENVEISFNFHQEISGISALEEWSNRDPVNHWQTLSDEILAEQYGLEQPEQTFFK
jgi:hypothetical protein